jgi:thioesterase domain-containing protein/acyl carrier protein
VRVASTAALRDPLRLLAMLREEPITFWDSAPAALQQLTPFLSGPPIEARLRLVFLSGDWIPLGLPDQVRGHFTKARVIALGGATEATVWSNSYAVEAVDAEWSSIPYGKPIQNARYYVLDGHLNPAPIGVAGDLYIGGECLALGYAADARLTARKFIPDAFGGAGGRLYATGDRARWRPAGHLEFLGRRDTQVKVRGFRIELGEIEAALRQQAGVRDAVAAVREQAGGRRLVGYVTAQAGEKLDLPELRRKLSERLPEYMVPGVVLELERLPVTANGKLDRKALPAPTAECGPGAGYAAPRTELQALLCRIWREVLQVERVGIEDNFFELGGHSLLAVQLAAELRRVTGADLPGHIVLQAPTVAKLAQAIAPETANLPNRSPLIVPIQANGSRPPLFFVHPSGGGVSSYSALARELGPDQPFYGVQAPEVASLNGDAPVCESMEELAAYYVAAIRMAQPEPPYFLGGWSYGGVVGYEMALQLEDAGAAACVALVDTWPRAANTAPEADECAILHAFAQEVAAAAGRPFPMAYDELRQVEPADRTAYLVARLESARMLARDSGLQLVRQYSQAQKTRDRIFRQYRAKPFGGRLALFRVFDVGDAVRSVAAANDADAEDLAKPAYGWEDIVGAPIEIELLPGVHSTVVFEPHVQVLAARLRQWLDRVNAEGLDSGVLTPAVLSSSSR